MFSQLLTNAHLTEYHSLGTIVIFCHKSGVDIDKLINLADKVTVTIDEQCEDDEVEETTGQIHIDNEEIGGFGISYSFVDDYLGPEFIQLISEKNRNLAEKIKCSNVESLVEIKGALTPDNVNILEPIIDELLENYEGIAFIDEVGLFSKDRFVLKVNESMYELD